MTDHRFTHVWDAGRLKRDADVCLIAREDAPTPPLTPLSAPMHLNRHSLDALMDGEPGGGNQMEPLFDGFHGVVMSPDMRRRELPLPAVNFQYCGASGDDHAESNDGDNEDQQNHDHLLEVAMQLDMEGTTSFLQEFSIASSPAASDTEDQQSSYLFTPADATFQNASFENHSLGHSDTTVFTPVLDVHNTAGFHTKLTCRPRAPTVSTLINPSPKRPYAANKKRRHTLYNTGDIPFSNFDTTLPDPLEVDYALSQLLLPQDHLALCPDSPQKSIFHLPESTLMVAGDSKARSQQVKCTFLNCDRSFEGDKNMRAHLRTHCGERPYSCGSCTMRFSRNHDLKRHERIHSGVRPYVCNHCDKTFLRLDALNRHLKVNNGLGCRSRSKKTSSAHNDSSVHDAADSSASQNVDSSYSAEDD